MQNANDAHPVVECSNKGRCDRSTGECVCYPNYDGIACERSICPNKCSDAGVCFTQKQLAAEAGRTYATPWDAQKQVGCVCDLGRRGPDCSLCKLTALVAECVYCQLGQLTFDRIYFIAHICSLYCSCFIISQLNAPLARTCSRATATRLAETARAAAYATTRPASAAASTATTEPSASSRPCSGKAPLLLLQLLAAAARRKHLITTAVFHFKKIQIKTPKK